MSVARVARRWETCGGRSDEVVSSDQATEALSVMLRSFSFYSIARVIDDLGAVS